MTPLSVRQRRLPNPTVGGGTKGKSETEQKAQQPTEKKSEQRTAEKEELEPFLGKNVSASGSEAVVMRQSSAIENGTTTGQHDGTTTTHEEESIDCHFVPMTENGDDKQSLINTIESSWRSILLLLIAPAVCLILGLLITPKYLPLSLVFLLTAARPLLYVLFQGKPPSFLAGCVNGVASGGSCCWPSSSPSSDENTTQQYDREQFESLARSSLQMHKSMAVQFSILGLMLFIYRQTTVHCLGGDDAVHDAYNSARTIVIWEDKLGMAIEPTLQNVFLQEGWRWVITGANGYYATMHFVFPLCVMVWLMMGGRDGRYEHRISFIVMLFIALIGYALVPTMPPRLMGRYWYTYIKNGSDGEAGEGDNESGSYGMEENELELMRPYWSIVDTMAASDTVYNKLHSEQGGNPYAAMPSMHTGWAVWSCITILAVVNAAGSAFSPFRRRALVTSGVLNVIIMVFIIVITGNHFILDAVAGAACAFSGRGLSLWLTSEEMVRRMGTIWNGVCGGRLGVFNGGAFVAGKKVVVSDGVSSQDRADVKSVNGLEVV